MRIAHVVTYISPDGAFGGPARVALGQAEALARLGHDVTVFSAAPVDAPREVEQQGIRLKTFPARRLARGLGFAGMFAPGLTRALKEQLPSTDIVHVHLARDLVTLPAARAARKAGVRLIVQPHGMIDRSTNPLAGPIDAWEVRSALRDAAAVLTLTERETEDIREVSPQATAIRISNGVSVEELPPYEGRESRVLFLARLHPRKRPRAFVEMARELGARGMQMDFVLAGPDEGEGPAVLSMVKTAGTGARISWVGAVDPAETDQLLRESRVYVLPSVGEVFPMSILEAFRAGTPVIATTSLGIAAKCEEYGAALLTDGTPSALADAVTRVVDEPGVAEGLRAGALRLLEAELSIDSVMDTLIHAYTAPRGGTAQ